MGTALTIEANKIADMVRDMNANDEMTFDVEPAFRTAAGIGQLRDAVIRSLSSNQFKSIEVAGECLRVTT